MENYTQNQSNVSKIIYLIISIVILCVILYFGISYYNYFTIQCYQKNTYMNYLYNGGEPCLVYQKPMPKVPPPPIIKEKPLPVQDIFRKKEVYHIGNQDYSFNQSKCKCASYGGRLATKDEVTNAYNKGANWCTYGWTEGQNAFYPVQKCYYDELSKDKDFMENSDKYCGKPGLNGGYFSDAELKFGVNCYGVKPAGSVVKAKKPSCNESKDFCSLPKNSYASSKLSTDEIAPFNDTKWSY